MIGDTTSLRYVSRGTGDKWPLARAVLLFSLVLGWMFCTSPWYEPARLLVEGVARPEAVRAKASWNSGVGFNNYERQDFFLLPYQDSGHEFLIEYSGERYFASDGSEVVLRGVEVDGQPLDLASLARTPARWLPGRGILLDRAGAAVHLRESGWRHLRLIFETKNYSGKVRLTVDGQASVHELYMANVEAQLLSFDWWFCDSSGHFFMDMDLPRYALRELELDSIPAGSLHFTRVSVQGKAEPCTLELLPEGAVKLRIEGVRLAMLRWFDRVRFAQQVLFALLTTWLLLALAGAVRRRGGARQTLLAPHRRSFWVLFVGAFTAYAAWLLAFWPGIMSVDSLKVWRAARLPETLINDHPLVNVLLYRWVQQIWDHVAAVSLLQVTCTALAISWILYRLRQRGISWAWLLPSYLFLVLSVPVGVYSVTLWKDVPFALLVLFWAFFLGEMWRRRREGRLSIGWQQGCVLLLLFGGLVFLRHNGLVYLFFIPPLMFVLGIVPRRRVVALLALGVAVGLLAGIVTQRTRTDINNDFVMQRGRQVLSYAREGLKEQWRWGLMHGWQILDINRQGHPMQDKFHEILGDRQAWWFLQRSGWSDVYPYQVPSPSWHNQLRSRALRLYYASLTPPWVYLTWNPVWLLPLLPLALVCARLRPEAAIFSSLILVQALSLLFLARMLNWRYYYFVCLTLWFLPPLIRGGKNRGHMAKEG